SFSGIQSIRSRERRRMPENPLLESATERESPCNGREFLVRSPIMRASIKSTPVLLALLLSTVSLFASSDQNNPTWWDKYTYLTKNGPAGAGSTSGSVSSGTNVDVSNECGPQSETFITLDTRSPKNLAAGSNEIFRLPMRGYYSRNSGKSWG